MAEPTPIYRIKDWSRRYETNETRKLKSLSWVKLNNKMDGLSFRLLAKRKDAPSVFCAWVLMLELASKSDPRGELTHNGIPLSPGEMGEITGFPGDIFKTALEFLSDPKIGWIDKISASTGVPGKSPEAPGENPASPSVEEKRLEETEGDEIEGKEEGGELDFKTHPWFANEEFAKEWTAWGKERRKAGTSRNFATLRGLAGDDLALATQIVAKSADNGWKGLFALDKKQDGQKGNSRQKQQGREYDEELKL